MLKKTILFTTVLIISGVTVAKDPCYCKRVESITHEQNKLIQYLESTDLEFTETVVNAEVSEIIQASYFYCEDDHGYLYVKLQNKEKLYKNVPLKTWFEFKFHEGLDSYYISQIKYNYIPV